MAGSTTREPLLLRAARILCIYRAGVPLLWGLASVIYPASTLWVFWPDLNPCDETCHGQLKILDRFWGGDNTQLASASILGGLLGNERLVWWILFFAVPHNFYEIWLSLHVLAFNSSVQLTAGDWAMWGDFVLHIVLALGTSYFLFVRRTVALPFKRPALAEPLGSSTSSSTATGGKVLLTESDDVIGAASSSSHVNRA